MKNTRKKMLLSSIAMLLVALVALGSATYAWFSTKTTADAAKLTAGTVKGTNLMISESKTTGWTQDLNLTTPAKASMTPVTPIVGSAANLLANTVTWDTATANGWDTQTASDWTEGVTRGNYTVEDIIYAKYDAASATDKFDLTVTLDFDVTTGTDDFFRVAVIPLTSTDDTDLTTPKGTDNTTDFTTQSIWADAAWAKGTRTKADYNASATTTISLGRITSQNVYGYKIICWYEGEDEDCVDSNSTNSIDVSFAFGGSAV